MKRQKLALFLLLGLAACGPGQDRSTIDTRPNTTVDVLRFTDVDDVTSLNPLYSSETNTSFLSEMTMAFLIRYDAAEKPIPELATVVPTQENGGVSKDGRVIIWHLRHGVTWSDGVPFTGDDVAFTVHAIQTNANNMQISQDGWNLITKTSQPDRYTIVFHLSHPFGAYLPTFFTTAAAAACILPKHILARYKNLNTAPYNSLPVGIGPFKYSKWDRGDQVVLVANSRYWKGSPKLKKVVYKILSDKNTALVQLKAKELDLWVFPSTGLYSELRNLPGYHTFTIPGYYYDHIDFNTDSSIVRDPVVRSALEMGIDRFTMNETLGQGLGIVQESIYSPASAFDDWSLPTTSYDIPKAKSMLDADGWKTSADGFRYKQGRRLRISIVTRTGSADVTQRLELVREGWKALGVDMQIKLYSAGLLFTPNGILDSGKFDAAIYTLGAGPDQDFSSIFASNQLPPHGQNWTRYREPSVDRAFDDIKATYDFARKKRDAHDIQWQIAKDVPTIVLNYRRDIYALSDHVQGFRPNATSPFDDMMNVTAK